MQKSDVIPLRGGLDLISPAMLVPPGFAIAAQNYEVEARGYRRVAGVERFDGQPRPSQARYLVLDFVAGSSTVLAGEIVVGATSAASGVALVDAEVESGSFGGADAAGYIVLWDFNDEFESGEALQVGGVTRMTTDGAGATEAAPTDVLHESYLAGAIAARRAMIAPPPGSGPVRGIATYLGDVYCWRDDAGGTVGQMFKAGSGGWALQGFGSLIRFDAGTAEFFEGETLTGGTSGATATIRRVVMSTGAWDGSAAGYLSVSGISGTFQDNEAVTSASGAAAADGTPEAVALPPGGLYRAEVENFYAQEGGTRLYFCNGVGPAMEWDGTTLAPILTGTASAFEKPDHIATHRLHLFVAYPGGSLQHSGPGTPLVFDAIRGAGEIGFGQDITGLLSNEKDTLIVAGRTRIGYLVGTSTEDFDLRPLSGDSGAIEDTLQLVGRPTFLDDRGVRDMRAAETYGNWRMGTQTVLVEPLLRGKQISGVRPVGSFRVRAKDQYRLFWDDGTGIVIYFGRRDPEIMPITLGFTPSCFHSGENADGDEVLFAGSVDGMVYELDRGTSFDGQTIEAFLRTPFMNQKAPNREKRYHRCRFEGQAGATRTALFLAADFSYGSASQPPGVETTFTINGSGGFWDDADWDRFNWDAALEGQAFAPLDGIGENVSVVVRSESATEEPHILSTLTINFSPRRMLR